eukprot:6891335-Prymnesium_polylepis.1
MRIIGTRLGGFHPEGIQPSVRTRNDPPTATDERKRSSVWTGATTLASGRFQNEDACLAETGLFGAVTH